MKLFTSYEPHEGQTRTIRTFAWLPTKVVYKEDRHYAWIWLQKYWCTQTYEIDWSSLGADICWKTQIRYI